ncbi:D-alanine--D-alanine ligase [Pseudomonas sp. NPDC089743]|uniref:D-alanine--D-alanine ligase family protein n=1 Tax=Pseudomonas sp. NPDC089743 TaxID=3364471 RepID=UPI0037FF2261
MDEHIAIITGGDSSEREVSLQTSQAVSQSLEISHIRHEIFTISDYRELLRLDLGKFTRVFLALHGGFGENGMAQAYLEGQGIPYNGPSPQTSAICMDKLLTKHIAKGLGINVANYLYSRRGDDLCIEKIKAQLGTPCIVKPNREGCSFGVSLVRDIETDLQDAITTAAQFHSGVLVEEFINGPELSVCYFKKTTLPIYSLAFESDFFSYEAKFISSKTTATLTTLDRATHQQLNNCCSAIADALELDYFRADFIIHNTEPYLIELNTLPGLTSHSLFPKACQQHGIGFDKLVLLLNNLEPSQYC